MMKNCLDFRILELDKSALKGDEPINFVPQQKGCGRDQTVIIAGVMLPSDTLENILASKNSGAEVIAVELAV